MANEFKVKNGLVVTGPTEIISSGSYILSADGFSGRLLQVDDGLQTGSIYSVNTVSGLPIIDVFADSTVRIGKFGQAPLFISQSKVGIGKETDLNAILEISGSTIINGNTTITGSLTVTSTITALNIPSVLSALGETISSQSLTNIQGLTQAVSAGTYTVDTWLYGSSSTAAGAQFSISASGTVTSINVTQMGNASTTTLAATAFTTTNDTSSSVFFTTAGAEGFVHITGEVVLSTAGNITSRAVKVTSGGLLIRPNSFMSVTKTA